MNHIDEYIISNECNAFILYFLQKTIEDYLLLYKAKTKPSQKYYTSAAELLFNDNYYIDWGENNPVNLKQILEMIDLDIGWIRKRVNKLREERDELLKKNKVRKLKEVKLDPAYFNEETICNKCNQNKELIDGKYGELYWCFKCNGKCRK